MENQKYKAVIFDLDGTLVDTVKDIGEAVNHALVTMGKTPKSVAYHRERVGWGLRASLEKSVPEETKEFVDKAYVLVEDYYKNHPCVYTEAYKGIPEVLETLRNKGLDLYVYTNKQEHIAKLVVEQVFGKDMFKQIFGTVSHRPLKPDKKGIDWVIEQTGLDASRILYVGDSEVDMETAAAGELDAAAVLWGFRTKEQLDGYPKMICAHRPDELIQVSLGNNK